MTGPSSIDLIHAIMLATIKHGTQRRMGGEMFWHHPARVALNASALGLSKEVCIAAALHDVVEDTNTTLDNLETYGISNEALRLVQLLTKPKDQATEGWKQRYYDGILTDKDAVILKMLDRTDNLQSAENLVAGNANPEWARTYYVKTDAEFGPLLAAVGDTGHGPSVRDRFINALTGLGTALEYFT